jgi:outer membrane protein, heavy metal efflux system
VSIVSSKRGHAPSSALYMWFAWAVVVLILTPKAANAETGETEREHALPLTLGDALSMAEKRAPNVAISRLGVQEAAARRIGAGLVFPSNPRASLEGRPAVTGGSFIGDMGYAASLDVPLDISGAPNARVREADRGIRVAESELRVETRFAKFRTWSAYVRSWVTGERIRELTRAVENAQRIVDAIKTRVLAGASGETDEALATVEVGELEAALERAKGMHSTELMSLRDALDLEYDRTLTLTTSFAEPPAAPDETRVRALALARRPELSVLQDRIELLSATHERLDKEVFPKMSVYGGVDAAPVSPIFGVLGVSVELPIAQRNQGPRARVLSERDTELARKTLFAKALMREVTAVRAAYASHKEELRLLEIRALPAAERALELVETGFRAGRFDLFRLTSALRELNRVKAERLDALETAWLAFISLDQAVGGVTQ